MQRLPYFFFLVCCALLLTFSACSSGKKALQRGDYFEAVELAVNRLRQSPKNRRAREALINAYPRMVNYALERITSLKRSSEPFRWEEIADLYGKLNRAADDIRRAPAANQVIRSPQSFRSEYERALTEAAQVRYNLGEREMARAYQTEDREAARRAFEHFVKTDELKPRFRDAREKAAEAREFATVHVLIEPIPMYRRTFNLETEFFQNQVLEFVSSQTWNPFVRFYAPGEIQRAGREPDHVVLMNFDDFVVGQTYVRESVEKRERDSVVIGQVKVREDDEIVQRDVYGTVKADVHLFEKYVISNGVLDVQILDPVSRRVVAQRKFAGDFEWRDFWGTYRGDEQALTDEDRRRLRNTREMPAPAPQALFVEFTRPIFGQVTQYLRDFYNRY